MQFNADELSAGERLRPISGRDPSAWPGGQRLACRGTPRERRRAQLPAWQVLTPQPPGIDDNRQADFRAW